MNKKIFNILLVLIMFFTVSTVVFAEDEEMILTTTGEEEQTEIEESNEFEQTEESKQTDDYYTNQGNGYELIIQDDADLLTDDEEAKLKDQMTKLTNYGNIAFVTLEVNHTSESEYSREFYHNHFGTSSGTMFLIDIDNRQLYIFSDGSNYKVITRQKAYLITDNVYTYAANEEYYKCASEAFYEILTLLEGGKIAEPMRHICNFILAITVSFLLCFMIVRSVSKIKEAKDSEIINNCSVRFEIGEITGIKIGEHRVYNPRTDSSSGGGSGGGGGGGGSSGGGGGHGF